MVRILALATLGVIIVAGWSAVAFVTHPGPKSAIADLSIPLVLGTMFGHATLAAAWTALGPLPLIRRLPLSFLWLAAVVLAFGFNLVREGNSQGFPVLLVYGSCLLLQWILVQLPLWLIGTRYRLIVCFPTQTNAVNEQRGHQFGIREVMALTALVAIVLGVGRLALGGIQGSGASGSFGKGREILIFLSLALANAIVSLPFLLSLLLPRIALVATCAGLLLAAFATAIELSLLSLVWFGPSSGWEDSLTFVAINAFQCAWVFAVIGLLRLGGFQVRRFAPALASG